MRITLSRQTLLRELALLRAVVDHKATIPILQNVLITVWPTGTCSFAAMNGSEAVLSDGITIEVDGSGPKQLAVPYDTLLALAKVVADGNVILEATKETHVELLAGSTRARLPLSSADDFPAIPDATDTIGTVPAGQLREILKQTRYAAGVHTGGMSSPCILIELDKEVRAVALDGHRLALSYRPLETPVEAANFILPSRAAVVLDSILEAAEPAAPVVIAKTENVAAFRVGQRLVVSRLIDQTFTSYKRILRANHQTIVEIPREALLLALRRLAVTAEQKGNYRGVIMTIGDGLITLASSSADIQGEDRVPVVIKGPGLRVRFNLNYVAEYFGLMETTTINAGFKGEFDPVEFGPVEPGVTCVVMPMRA